MYLNFQDQRPIFIQLAEGIEDAILSGAYCEETQIPSTTEISVRYRINPATALKGINILVEDGIIYKKRGVGMFVSQGAKTTIARKRRNHFYETYIEKLIDEAKKLGISLEEVKSMLEGGFKK